MLVSKWNKMFAGGLVLLAATAFSTLGVLPTSKVHAQDSVATAGPTDEEIARVEAISSVFRKVAQKVTPAVVRIRAESGVKKPDAEDEDAKKPDMPDELKKFFKDRGLPDMPKFWKRFPDQPRMGLGSGVIIDAKNGYVLTNNHVVADADPNDVTVFTADQRRFKPEWIRTDEMSDVAVMKLRSAENLVEVKLGDSDKIQVGDWVLAIGSPFGEHLSKTVTFGIVSAKGRDVGLSIDYQNFIQTDAAINPGNSGGPLVNLRGDVVGLNTAIASGTAQYAGIGFALPSNMVKWVVGQLIQDSRVTRGYLGVQIQNLEDQPGLAKSFGLKSSKGVVITEVMGVPARDAGLKSGDVILTIDGKEIANTTDLSGRVAMIIPGAKARFGIWRDGKSKDIEVTIGKQPKGFHTRVVGSAPKDSEAEEEVAGKIDILGITVAALSESNGKKFGWKGDEGGLLITEVEPRSEASDTFHLQPGDVIAQAQGKPVKTVEEFRKLATKQSLADGIQIMIKSKRSGSRYIYLQTR